MKAKSSAGQPVICQVLQQQIAAIDKKILDGTATASDLTLKNTLNNKYIEEGCNRVVGGPGVVATIFVPRQELGVGDVGDVVFDEATRTVYFGRVASHNNQRLNLGVVHLDANGQLNGPPVFYPDSLEPLPALNWNGISRIVLDTARRKLYLSFTQSPQLWQSDNNLSVYDLDANGDPMGTPRAYATTVPQPVGAASSLGSVTGMALDPGKSLYLTGSTWAGYFAYQLDANSGEPVPPAQPQPVGSHFAGDIALSADGQLIYLLTYDNTLEVVRAGQTAVLQQSSLAASPATTLKLRCTTQALYLFYPPDAAALSAQQVLFVWPLDTQTGLAGTVIPVAIGYRAMGVDAASNTLWIAGDETFEDAMTAALIVSGLAMWQCACSADGAPVLPAQGDAPDATADLCYGLAVAIGSDGTPVVLTANFSESTAAQTVLLAAEGGEGNIYLAPVPPNFPGNQLNGYTIAVTVKEAENAAGAELQHVFIAVNGVPTQPAMINSAGTYTPIYKGVVAVGSLAAPTPLIPLDNYLMIAPTAPASANMKASRRYPFSVNCAPSDAELGSLANNRPSALNKLELQIDVYSNAGGVGPTLQTLTPSVYADTTVFLLPCYGFEDDTQRESDIQTLEDYAKSQLASATQVEVPSAQRPGQLVLSCYYAMGCGEANPIQLSAVAGAMSRLGLNTTGAGQWVTTPVAGTGGWTAANIEKILTTNGITMRHCASYTPLDSVGTFSGNESALNYFAFYLQNNPQVAPWVSAWKQFIQTSIGASPGQVHLFAISDEPGWYYPDIVIEASGLVAGWLAEFVAYLQNVGAQRGFQPQDFNAAATKWTDLGPLTPYPVSGPMSGLPVQQRRLMFWTLRYFTESATLGHKLVNDSLVQSFGPQLMAYVNYASGGWYQYYHWNADTCVYPGAPWGGMDWFFAGRQRAHTLWSEFLAYASLTQTVSAMADRLRSAAMLGTNDPAPLEFGAYLLCGDLPLLGSADAQRRVLSMIGHGAKALTFYTFGPPYSGQHDTWADYTFMYGSIADALRLVGVAEHLLMPGRPARGHIALLDISQCAVWDNDPTGQQTFYGAECVNLHFALVHAGYSVDFVDDVDIQSGALSDRKYSALYVCGPNVSSSAQQKIADWVSAGGFIAVGLGAGVADLYDSPTTLLDEVLGLAPGSRNEVRSAKTLMDPPAPVLSIVDNRLGAGSVSIVGSGALAALEPAGATVAATVEIPDSKNSIAAGSPVATINQYGQGLAIAYGFFPGFEYSATPNEDDVSGLPYGWSDTFRGVVTAPARLANTPRVVTFTQGNTEIPLVEACRLDSPAGVAIVLLNWSNMALGAVTLTIPNIKAFQTVKSAQGVAVGAPQPVAGGGLSVVLNSLRDVDVLMFE